MTKKLTRIGTHYYNEVGILQSFPYYNFFFQVLHFLRMTVPKTPVVRSIMPSFAYRPNHQGIQSRIPPMTDPISLTRIFCGALFFPTIATFLGASLYKSVPSQFKRTLLGGLTFAVVKGLLKIYHKQHQYIRTCQKQILDHQE